LPQEIIKGIIEGRQPLLKQMFPLSIKVFKRAIALFIILFPFPREFKRGFASLHNQFPLPLNKGKGIKGIGLSSNP